MSARDLLGEAFAGLLARPARVLLTVLGTVIGVGALVATLGLSKTASNQIVGHFDALEATDIVVSPSVRGGGARGAVLPWDAEARLRRLNGVVAAGTLADVDVRGALVRSVPINDPLAAGATQLPMKAASPGVFQAVHAQLSAGRFFDAGHSQRGDRVVVLGVNAARRVGISRVDQQPAIFIGDRLYVVIGILAGVRRQPELPPGGALGHDHRAEQLRLAADPREDPDDDVEAVADEDRRLLVHARDADAPGGVHAQDDDAVGAPRVAGVEESSCGQLGVDGLEDAGRRSCR